MQVRGGQKTCMNPQEFLEFLVLNPEVSYMWADHHQLQVTANLYNTTVQVLTVDEYNNGSLLHESFKPDPRLAEFSLIPARKPNGDKIEVEEVWLLYSNNNHYDALVAEDSKIMTLNTEICIDKEEQEIKDFLEINESDKPEVKDPAKGNTQIIFPSFQEIVTGRKHSDKTKAESETEKVEKIQDKPKDDTDILAKLAKEIKDHNTTKKALKDLNDEYTKCKEELRLNHEEKE